VFYFSAGFLVLSGIASLTYQVAWVRLIGLSLGSTSASISTVLAAFFFGLALGSFLAERLTRNRINSLLPYALLEAVIGLSGLALLPILLNLDGVMALIPAAGTELWLKFAIAAALLIIPTTAMGATFPVMAAVLIRTQEHVGTRISQLYGFNTFGAVLGAGLSGFVLIPAWGLDGAIYAAATLNAIVVVGATIANFAAPLRPISMTAPQVEGAEAPSPAASTDTSSMRWRAAATLVATGFASVAAQVGWTKYLAMFTGSTIYGLSAILTVFLAGIAVGSWVIGTFIDRIARPRLFMAGGLLALAATLVLARAGLSLLPPVQGALNVLGIEGVSDHLVRLAIVLVLIFPPTFVFGMLFPINLKLYCGDVSGVRKRVGEAYALNTLASIGGAVLAGFWIIPAFGTDVLLTGVALGMALLPLVWGGEGLQRIQRFAIPALVLVVLAGNQVLGHLDFKALVASVGYDDSSRDGKTGDFLFLKEGKAGVITLVSYDGKSARLQNNGLNESQISLTNSNNLLTTEALLGLVPYLLHQDAKSAFMLGFGGGISTTALTMTGLEKIHVVELEPAVVDAVRTIKDGPATALDDPRVSLEFNDARNTLLVQPTTYDIIVSQPSHPWLSGSANVFTQEFWAVAKSRLNDGGVFSQWVNLFQMDATTLKALLKSFYTVFPEGLVLANNNAKDLIMIGSTGPLTFDYARIDKILAQPKVRQRLESSGIFTTQDVLWFFAMSRNEAVTATADATPNRDTNILSEVRLSALTGDATGDEDPYDFIRQNSSFDITPYIGADAQKLMRLSSYFLSWERYDRARLVDDQLAAIDPQLGAEAAHDRLIAMNDLASASKLYATRTDWPAKSQLKQATALLDAGMVQDARPIIAQLEDPATRRATEARLAFVSRDWAALAQHSIATGEERTWYLLGVAQTDPVKAGLELQAIDPPASARLPVSRALLRYQSLKGTDAAIDKASTVLASATSELAARYTDIATKAAKAGDAAMAQRVRDLLQSLAPNSEALKTLNTAIASISSQ
jgi:spermidine synthase